jgi:uncharacterized Zn-binding protein involved in type VI secretion
MGTPVVAGDFGGPYTPPGTAPPQIATVIQGSSRVFIKGKSIALFGQAFTTLGPIITSTLNSSVALIEGKPVILGGSVTNLGSGYSNGQLFALGAIGVNVS